MQELLQFVREDGVSTVLLFLIARYAASRLDRVGAFFAPLIKRGIESHSDALDNIPEAWGKSNGILEEIRDWLKDQPPPPASGMAAAT